MVSDNKIRIAWHPNYCHPLPNNHRFPMHKYDLLPQQLMYHGIVDQNAFFAPSLPSDNEYFKLVHTDAYLLKLDTLNLTLKEERLTGFPLSKALIEREKTIAFGTVMAADYSLKYGCAANIAGGTHHAFSDHGEGFCILNDMAIAAAYLLKTSKVKRIAIIDLDVHQGNGTASIFKGNKDVFTFSMHSDHNYPFRKEVSDLDIALEDGITDLPYLSALATTLSNDITAFSPDFVFYQAGVDVLATDKLGRLGLSKDGCKKRDEMVLKYCFQRSVPIVVVMGGSYSPNIADILEAHCNTFSAITDIFFS